MKISYAITTHNEGECIDRLLVLLSNLKSANDEIVVVDDYSSDITKAILEEHLADDNISLWTHALDNNFADHKNFLNSKCTGDYIFQIDADELPSEYMITNLSNLLEQNPTVDLFLVPRINTVSGLTQDHINKWNWKVDKNGYVNFPDYQTRIYKNLPNIVWAGKVHEQIVGNNPYAYLPAEPEWCLKHEKDIAKQELQNEFYSNTFI